MMRGLFSDGAVSFSGVVCPEGLRALRNWVAFYFHIPGYLTKARVSYGAESITLLTFNDT